MLGPIKPGTLCWLVNCDHPDWNGRVVEVTGPEVVRSLTTVTGAKVVLKVYPVAAEWLPERHVGWFCERKNLRPFSDPTGQPADGEPVARSAEKESEPATHPA